MNSKTKLEFLLISHFDPQALKSYFVQFYKGQYFSSNIDKIKVSLENSGEVSEIELIVKTLPSEDSEIEANAKLKFAKEIDFYQLAIPEYQRIQANNKLPEEGLFPRFYTASEGIIVLEDLNSTGYNICDRYLDEFQTKLVLQELAKFHATGIALKLSNPNIFEDHLASVVIPALRNASNPERDDINKKFRSEIKQLMEANHELRNFAEDIDSLLNYIDNTKLPTPSEQFSTLLHNDLWKGNILFKYSQRGELCDVKFIDFQTVIFNSPARDLIYFLFSSVEDSVLSGFNDLIKLYHLSFVNYLHDLGFDSSKYTLDGLMFEINCFGPSKLKHLLLLFKVLSSSVGTNENERTNFEHYLKRIVQLFRNREWI